MFEQSKHFYIIRKYSHIDIFVFMRFELNEAILHKLSGLDTWVIVTPFQYVLFCGYRSVHFLQDYVLFSNNLFFRNYVISLNIQILLSTWLLNWPLNWRKTIGCSVLHIEQCLTGYSQKLVLAVSHIAIFVEIWHFQLWLRKSSELQTTLARLRENRNLKVL